MHICVISNVILLSCHIKLYGLKIIKNKGQQYGESKHHDDRRPPFDLLLYIIVIIQHWFIDVFVDFFVLYFLEQHQWCYAHEKF